MAYSKEPAVQAVMKHFAKSGIIAHRTVNGLHERRHFQTGDELVDVDKEDLDSLKAQGMVDSKLVEA